MYRPPRVIKPSVNRKNPEFSKEIFFVYMPAMQQFVETPQGTAVFNEYRKIANGRVFKMSWGDEWEEGMSLLIAHFITLWAQRASTMGSSMSKSIGGIAAMGAPKGVQTSISVGELSKSWDFGLTTLPTDKENAFYNKTEFGQDYYSRMIQKRSLSIALAWQ